MIYSPTTHLPTELVIIVMTDKVVFALHPSNNSLWTASPLGATWGPGYYTPFFFEGLLTHTVLEMSIILQRTLTSPLRASSELRNWSVEESSGKKKMLPVEFAFQANVSVHRLC